MDDYTDDFDDDFCDDDGYTEDESLFEDDQNDLDDDFRDDGGGEGFDLSLEDATPIGGFNVKKAVIFGIAMEWEDEEKRKELERKKKMGRKRM